MTTKLIRDAKFRKIASNIKPDSKNRIGLSKAHLSEDITYHIYVNDMGQIILDPQISVPASEIWLYRNKEALESVMAGIKDAAEGRIRKIMPDAL